MPSFLSKLFVRNKTVISLPEALKSLPIEYTIFQSIIYNRTEIQAVIFHKSQGIVIINLCNEKGKVTFDGTAVYINKNAHSGLITKCLQDIFWLKSTIRQKIGIDVMLYPIIAFTRANVQVSQHVLGVKLLPIEQIVTTILSFPHKYSYPDGVLITLRELHEGHNIFPSRDDEI